MYGDATSRARGFGDSRRELRFGVLIGRVQVAVDNLVPTCLVDLGEVGALLHLFANDFD